LPSSYTFSTCFPSATLAPKSANEYVPPADTDKGRSM
jgi:hypothetical protein